MFFCCSDYRSSVIGPSDSEKDCPSRRDSDTSHAPHAPKLGVTAPSGDSESGGSHSPSPRASRRRQVIRKQYIKMGAKKKLFNFILIVNRG